MLAAQREFTSSQSRSLKPEALPLAPPRSRQRTATIGVFGFATVQSVRNALADIKRARLSDERLPVRTASCGSRRERFATRRVGEYVSSDVSLCTSHRS